MYHVKHKIWQFDVNKTSAVLMSHIYFTRKFIVHVQALVLDLPLGPAAKGGAVGGRAVPVEGVRWRREGRRCGGSKVRGEG